MNNLFKLTVEAFQNEGLRLSSRHLVTLAGCCHHQPALFGIAPYEAVQWWSEAEKRLKILDVLRATLEMQPNTSRSIAMSFAVSYVRIVRKRDISQSLISVAMLSTSCGLLDWNLGEEALNILSDLHFDRDLPIVLGEDYQMYKEVVRLRKEVDAQVDQIIHRLRR